MAVVTAPAEAGTGTADQGRGRDRPPWLIGLLFLLPALVLLGALVVYPIIATVFASFRDGTGSGYVGLDNYRTMFRERRILLAIRNNIVWVAVVPAAVTAIGLVFAVLSERIAFQRAFRTAVFMPMAISLVAGGVIWRVVYEQAPERGLLNAGINSVAKVLDPPGRYAGATASEGMAPSAGGFVRNEPVQPGDAVSLGLVGLPPQQVPESAEPGRLSEPASAEEIVGVVHRDFTPGGSGRRGALDPTEVGLPDMKVDLLDGTGRVVKSALSGADGSFRFREVDSGTYRVALSASNFRAPFGGVAWLGPSLILPSVMAAYVWVWAGFAMMVLAAGLAAIPREVLEAARVDGASEWQTFRRVTVPLLAPEMGVVFVTLVIYVLKVFDIVLVVAPPEVQTEANVIALEMWRTAFGARNQGLGSAVAVLLFVMVLPVMILNLRRFRAERG